jgi:hypothetical protein
VLAKELTAHSRVVVDLDGLRVGRESSVTVFPAVLTQCGGWPSAKLALCRPDDAMVQALTARGVAALVPVYHLRLEAEAAIDERPPVVRIRLHLPFDTGSAASARRLVRENARSGRWTMGRRIPPSSSPVSWCPTRWNMPAPVSG